MSFLWSCEQFYRLVILVALEMTSPSFKNITALINKSLVWLELHIGLVLRSSTLFDEYAHIVCASLLILVLLISYWFVRWFQRRRRTPLNFNFSSSSPYKHRRTRTPEFPPGMEFNLVQERWREKGMEEPLVERRAFGAGRPAELPPVRRPIFSVPEAALRPLPSDKSPVNTSFGRVGWS